MKLTKIYNGKTHYEFDWLTYFAKVIFIIGQMTFSKPLVLDLKNIFVNINIM